MQTTIKVTKETKNRIISLAVADKNKTYDAIINELITYYQKSEKGHTKRLKNWDKDWKRHEKDLEEYNKTKKKKEKEWNRLVKWAKSRGFKE